MMSKEDMRPEEQVESVFEIPPSPVWHDPFLEMGEDILNLGNGNGEANFEREIEEVKASVD